MVIGTLALALALALAADPDALAPARAALEKGDLARAEVLALAAAAPPHQGAALDLVGAARFRAGRPAEALDAFERAARAADPPPPGRTLFNRAACLEALGRLAEAEARYVEAARADPALASMALASAGWAALDADAPERARTWGEEARAAGGPGVALAEELLTRLGGADQEAGRARAAAAHAEGLAAYDTGRWSEAHAAFLRAIELDPGSAPSQIMAGAAAARLGDVAEARRLLTGALTLPLTGAQARAARAHLAALDAPAAAPRPGWSGAIHLGGGRDGDVLESGSARAGGIAGVGRLQSGFLAGGLSVRRRAPLGAPGASLLELGYRVEQLAYLAAAAEDYGVQEHTLWAVLEAPLGARVASGLQASAFGAFTGTSRFRGLQAGGNLRGWAALDAGGGLGARLDLAYTAKSGIGEEFQHLGGDRWDGSVAQSLRAGPITVGLAYGARLERIGTLWLSGRWPVPEVICPFDRCDQRYQVPLAYLEQRLSLSAQAAVGARLRLSASAGWGWRAYRGESALHVADELGGARRLDAFRRQDRRFTIGGSVVVRATRALELTLSGERTLVRSNVAQGGGAMACQPPDFRCHALDYGDANARRAVVNVDVGWRW